MSDHASPDTRQVARFSQHRPAPIALPNDPRLAAAAVLAYINGDDGVERAGAVEAMIERATELAVADCDKALEGLAGHLPVLNALFLRFTAEAMATKTPDHKSKYVKIALGAQAAFARTQALLVTLKTQRDGRASVVVEAIS